MRFFFCIVLSLLTYGITLADTLELVSEPSGGRLVDLKVIGENLYAAQRGNGSVLVSKDGGKTFSSTKVGGSKTRSFAYLKDKLYVSVEDKGVFASSDSGESFEGPSITKNRSYFDLAVAGGVLWVSTSTGLFKYTGEKWSPIPGIQESQTNAGDGDRLAVAVGSKIFYSADGGNIWKKLELPDNKRVLCLTFDKNTLLVGSEEKGLLKVNLTNFSIETTSLVEQVQNNAHVVCVGIKAPGYYAVGLRDQGLWISKDSGKSWTEVKDAEGNPPREVQSFATLNGQVYAGIGNHLFRLVP